ncbi:MAG: hypothetical protein EBT59_09445 [Betaproteobacteria bacterium]|nr:hypothetical protein [Betaproteobacteria bacterium]
MFACWLVLFNAPTALALGSISTWLQGERNATPLFQDLCTSSGSHSSSPEVDKDNDLGNMAHCAACYLTGLSPNYATSPIFDWLQLPDMQSWVTQSIFPTEDALTPPPRAPPLS